MVQMSYWSVDFESFLCVLSLQLRYKDYAAGMKSIRISIYLRQFQNTKDRGYL